LPETIVKNRLNYTLLRSFDRPVRGGARTTVDGIAGNAHLSRRTWLGVAGSAAVFATPVMKSVSNAAIGRADVRQGKGWVAFSVRGE
jgi:hypothetical protein